MILENFPNLIITGYKEHGKNTACNYLQSRYALDYIESSRFACEKFIFEKMREFKAYKSVQECYLDRVNNRPYWYREIQAYNTPDKARLGREIFVKAPVYNGIRCILELDALIEAGLVKRQHILWIDASERMPVEDKQSMTVGPEHAGRILSNNTTHDDLFLQLDTWYIETLLNLGGQKLEPSLITSD